MDTFLVVLLDDNQTMNFLNRKICGMVFDEARIKVFTQGQEALDFLATKSKKDDASKILVLLDINMPQMDGWEFLEHMQSMPHAQKVKVAMLSSSPAEADKARSRQYSNVVHYIEKPLSKDNLRFLQTLLDE